ncbi:MAG: hypothetical protein OXH32_08540 [Acidobacteria bacterium]|nr:hypothetical protein [Acidobacteriota bacterium]
MSPATDTLRTAQTLTEAGVPDRQASAHARAINEAMTEAVGDLATRADLRAGLTDLRAELATLRSDMYRALWIQGGVIIGAVVALMRLFP